MFDIYKELFGELNFSNHKRLVEIIMYQECLKVHVEEKGTMVLKKFLEIGF